MWAKIDKNSKLFAKIMLIFLTKRLVAMQTGLNKSRLNAKIRGAGGLVSLLGLKISGLTSL